MNNIFLKINPKIAIITFLLGFAHLETKSMSSKKKILQAERDIWLHGLRKKNKKSAYLSSLSLTHQVITDTLNSGKKSVARGTQIKGYDVSGPLSTLQKKYIELRLLLKDQEAYMALTGVQLNISPKVKLVEDDQKKNILSLSPIKHIQYKPTPTKIKLADSNQKKIINLAPGKPIQSRVVKINPFQLVEKKKLLSLSPIKHIQYKPLNQVKKVKKHTLPTFSFPAPSYLAQKNNLPKWQEEKWYDRDTIFLEKDLGIPQEKLSDQEASLGSNEVVNSPIQENDVLDNMEEGTHSHEANHLVSLQDQPGNLAKEIPGKENKVLFNEEADISISTTNELTKDDNTLVSEPVSIMKQEVTPPATSQADNDQKNVATVKGQVQEENSLFQNSKGRLIESPKSLLVDTENKLPDETNDDFVPSQVEIIKKEVSTIGSRQSEEACFQEITTYHDISESNILDKSVVKAPLQAESLEGLTDTSPVYAGSDKANLGNSRNDVLDKSGKVAAVSKEKNSIPVHAYIVGMIMGIILDRILVEIVKRKKRKILPKKTTE